MPWDFLVVAPIWDRSWWAFSKTIKIKGIEDFFLGLMRENWIANYFSSS